MWKKEIGYVYEKIAARYLEDKGYKVLDTNYNTRYGEIDLIAYKDSIYVFCEVKYRKDDSHGLPIEFVTDRKQDKLSRAAMFFIMHNQIVESYRFDVIGILGADGDQIVHIENAFKSKKYMSNFE